MPVRSTAAGRSLLAPLAVIAGTIVLVLAGTLPVWGVRLLAPQYPKGLELWFYGGRAEGPLREVNGLNHYIGMRPIDLAAVPELALWPLAVLASAFLLVMAVLFRGWLGRLALAALFLVPVAVLVDIQRWLIVFGSQLDPGSALRLDPFVPLVIGPSTIWNFTIWTYPGPALALVWASVVLAAVARRAARPSLRAGLAAAGVAAVLAIAGTAFVVVPSVRPADGPTAIRDDPPDSPVDLAQLVGAAQEGSTVVVPAGTYRGHLTIDRPLTLVANGDVLLHGGGRGSVVTITASDVTIRGFRVAHTGGQVEEAAAIKTVDAERVSIEDNRIEDAFTGIAVNGGSAVRIIANEIVGSGQVLAGAGHVTAGAAVAQDDGHDPHAGHAPGSGPGGQGDGIALWNVRGALVRGNIVRDARDGVYLNYADEVLVDANRIERSRYAVHAMFGRSLTVFGNEARANLSGLVFMNSTEVLAGRNILVDARSAGTGFGVVVKDVSTFRLAENLVARNRIGLQAEGTTNGLTSEAVVVSNRFASNDIGVALMPSADLVFGGNEFQANLTQVAALGVGVERRNFWAHEGVGNLWSDYAGYDLAGDGIGDVPHQAGGALDQLVVDDPALAAFRTSPATTALAAGQAVWEAARPPVVVDLSPRLRQVGTDAVPLADPPPPGAQAWQAGGAAMLVVAVLGTVSAARVRRVVD